MSINKKRAIKILCYLLMSFCVIALTDKYYSKVITVMDKRRLKNLDSKIIVSGRVREISEVLKSNGKWIRYKFTYKGKDYYNEVMDNFNYKCAIDYNSRFIPVVIDSLYPGTNFILFHKRDYSYFNYSIPDTMNWLFDCVVPSGSYIFSTAPISPDH